MANRVRSVMTADQVKRVVGNAANAKFTVRKVRGKRSQYTIALEIKTDTVAQRVMKSVKAWGFNVFCASGILAAASLKGLIALGVVAFSFVSWPAILVVLAVAVSAVAIFAICEAIDAYRFGNSQVDTTHVIKVGTLTAGSKREAQDHVNALDLKKWKFTKRAYNVTLSAKETHNVLTQSGGVELRDNGSGDYFLRIKGKGFKESVKADIKKYTCYALRTGPLLLLAVPVTLLVTTLLSGVYRGYEHISGADTSPFSIQLGDKRNESLDSLGRLLQNKEAIIKVTESGGLLVHFVKGGGGVMLTQNRGIPPLIRLGLGATKLAGAMSDIERWRFAIQFAQRVETASVSEQDVSERAPRVYQQVDNLLKTPKFIAKYHTASAQVKIQKAFDLVFNYDELSEIASQPSRAPSVARRGARAVRSRSDSGSSQSTVARGASGYVSEEDGDDGSIASAAMLTHERRGSIGAGSMLSQASGDGARDDGPPVAPMGSRAPAVVPGSLSTFDEGDLFTVADGDCEVIEPSDGDISAGIFKVRKYNGFIYKIGAGNVVWIKNRVEEEE